MRWRARRTVARTGRHTCLPAWVLSFTLPFRIERLGVAPDPIWCALILACVSVIHAVSSVHGANLAKQLSREQRAGGTGHCACGAPNSNSCVQGCSTGGPRAAGTRGRFLRRWPLKSHGGPGSLTHLGHHFLPGDRGGDLRSAGGAALEGGQEKLLYTETASTQGVSVPEPRGPGQDPTGEPSSASIPHTHLKLLGLQPCFRDPSLLQSEMTPLQANERSQGVEEEIPHQVSGRMICVSSSKTRVSPTRAGLVRT